MAQDRSAPAGSKDALSALATEIEERQPLEVEEGPRTRTTRHVYWLIGGVCALIVGVVEVSILMGSVASADAPPPPPVVMEQIQNDTCASRMSAVMNGILAYEAKTGARPPTLAALYPEFIAFQPIDPAANQPYGYAVMGESITLTCPSAAVTAAAQF